MESVERIRFANSFVDDFEFRFFGREANCRCEMTFVEISYFIAATNWFVIFPENHDYGVVVSLELGVDVFYRVGTELAGEG